MFNVNGFDYNGISKVQGEQSSFLASSAQRGRGAAGGGVEQYNRSEEEHYEMGKHIYLFIENNGCYFCMKISTAR